MTDAEKKPCCCTAEPAEKDTVPSCCRHKDRTPEEYRALANRLSRIEGQVRGIRAMLDKDVYCADILVQVAAVNAALNGFSKELLGQHIRTCVAGIDLNSRFETAPGVKDYELLSAFMEELRR